MSSMFWVPESGSLVRSERLVFWWGGKHQVGSCCLINGSRWCCKVGKIFPIRLLPYQSLVLAQRSTSLWTKTVKCHPSLPQDG